MFSATPEYIIGVYHCYVTLSWQHRALGEQHRDNIAQRKHTASNVVLSLAVTRANCR